jgi:uncharacterized protein (DUF1499 family)
MKILLLLGLLGIIGLLSGCSGARKAESLGLLEGHLRACPSSPNCVSSAAIDVGQQIDPFLLQVDPAEAWAAVQKAVLEQPRAQIVSVTENYLHAEFSSAVFGFTDDLELQLLPEQRQIAIRSAARLGYYDFGVNRNRIERLRLLLKGREVLTP